MMDFRVLWIVLMVTILSVTGNQNIKVQDDTANIKDILQRASTRFAADVYSKLSTKEGNVLFSPLSAHLALTMVGAGACGNTSDEISRALWMPQNKEIRLNSVKWLIDNIKSNDGITHIANKIFLADKFDIKPFYNYTVNNYFNAEIGNIDFSNQIYAAGKINSWIEKHTMNKIKDALDAQKLSPNTKMVLVNALYFKNDWMAPFSWTDTTESPFHINEHEDVIVKMMSQINGFQYARNQKLQADFIQIPYKGGDYVMTVVLPKQKNGLAHVEANINDIFDEQEWQNKYVQLVMPKFKYEVNMELTSLLKEIGIAEAFDSRANFTEMTEEKVQISDVIQKTFIEVDEDGTTAAAATVVGVIPLSLPMDPGLRFVVDHPFLFFLQRRISGENLIIFIGRVTNPQNVH